jgi:hypothetical protein
MNATGIPGRFTINLTFGLDESIKTAVFGGGGVALPPPRDRTSSLDLHCPRRAARPQARANPRTEGLHRDRSRRTTDAELTEILALLPNAVR